MNTSPGSRATSKSSSTCCRKSASCRATSRERATSMPEDAGFGEIDIHELEHDIQNDFYVVRH